MNHPQQHLLIAALLATLGFAASAQTAPPAPAASGASHMAKMHERMQERMTRRLSGLKQKLQLSPGQEGAWTSYTTALQPTPFQRPERGEMARLTTPERIDRMRAMRTAHMAEMDKRADATKTFYAVLTPEQKKIFDQETLRRGPGGERHHGHHHG